MDSTPDVKTLEQALVRTIRTLHPRRVAEVLDFARWLQTQPEVDQATAETLTAAELEAEERAWEAAYEANREEFRALARQALEELDAGVMTA